MDIIFNKLFFGHDTGHHPESPKRLDIFRHLPDTAIPDGKDLPPLVHTKDYIDNISTLFARGEEFFAETRIVQDSYETACRAAAATVLASETGGFALCRPPGHHAFRDHSAGFCLFNNVAIAAARLQQMGFRVAILDFDGHYGDGTSSIFYDNDQVLYWSFHQYPAYPERGMFYESGFSNGQGYNINVPLPAGTGDDIFMDAFDHTAAIVEQFKPDVLAISAGFDSHYSDPLLQLKFSRDVYHWLGLQIRKRFPRNFAVLEGGYNLIEMPYCLENFVAGINGHDLPHPEGGSSSSLRSWETYEIYIHGLLAEMQNFWKI